MRTFPFLNDVVVYFGVREGQFLSSPGSVFDGSLALARRPLKLRPSLIPQVPLSCPFVRISLSGLTAERRIPLGGGTLTARINRG